MVMNLNASVQLNGKLHFSLRQVLMTSSSFRPWDGYNILRKGAEGAGVRCGPSAITVFSCNGRGASIFADSELNEAVITDKVYPQERIVA
jgi:hypothetical protein